MQPYWRLAIEPHWGDHYLEVGTFGMYGQIVPQSAFGFGVDTYTDVGFDSQYQYDGDKYSVTVKLTDILEYQRLNASVANGFASNTQRPTQQLQGQRVIRVGPHLQSRRRLFQRLGHSDCLIYGLCGSGLSASSSPNGDGLIADVAYLPFSHGSPGPYSTWNARLGVQYTHYLHLYGGTTNFDGSSLGAMHNASGNDTLLLYAWLMF